GNYRHLAVHEGCTTIQCVAEGEGYVAAFDADHSRVVVRPLASARPLIEVAVASAPTALLVIDSTRLAILASNTQSTLTLVDVTTPSGTTAVVPLGGAIKGQTAAPKPNGGSDPRDSGNPAAWPWWVFALDGGAAGHAYAFVDFTAATPVVTTVPATTPF